MRDPLDSFPAFVAELRARLEAGRRAYGDRSFDRAPGELLAEIEQELLDVCGWSVVMFERIRRLRERVPVVLRPGEPSAEPSPRTRVGRMVALPASDVACVPLLALEGSSPKAWRALPPVLLSRVPVQGECLLDGDGRTLHVLGVRHLSGDVAAELHCEQLRLTGALLESAAR